MNNKSVGILGIGKYVPEKKVTNDDLVSMGLDTSDEWIFERTGIRSRYIVSENETTSDLAYKAALKAVKDASLTVDDIDMIIVATTTPDYRLFPSTAAVVQNLLKINRPIPAFDVAAACSGFSYTLSIAENYIKSGHYKNVLVLGADVLSKNIDWTDRTTCVLFGDGAGAVILGEVEPEYGILYTKLYADGSCAEILKADGGTKSPLTEGFVRDKSHFIKMNGRLVFKEAVKVIDMSIKDLLDDCCLNLSDISYYVAHQANMRILDYVRQKQAFKTNQVLSNIDKYGNTSAASIPLVLDDFNHQFKKGDYIILNAFGAGFTWGVNLIRWSK